MNLDSLTIPNPSGFLLGKIISKTVDCLFSARVCGYKSRTPSFASSSNLEDANEARRVVGLSSSIFSVISLGCYAKIAFSVIQRLQVGNMIHKVGSFVLKNLPRHRYAPNFTELVGGVSYSIKLGRLLRSMGAPAMLVDPVKVPRVHDGYLSLSQWDESNGCIFWLLNFRSRFQESLLLGHIITGNEV